MNSPSIEQLMDPAFYLSNFCKIKGKEGKGLIPFILKPAQLDIFNTINKHNRVICMKARQIGFCLHPDTNVLLSDLRWVKLKDIQIGEKIVSVDEVSARHAHRKMREGSVLAKWEVFEETFKLIMDDGTELIATGQHRFLSQARGNTETVWRTVNDTFVGDKIRMITKTWGEPDFEDGWFAGLVDGEGSLCKKTRTGSALTISQVEGPVLDRLIQYVNKKGFSFRIEWDKRLPGVSSKLGSKVVCKIVIGNLGDVFRALGQARPSRMQGRDWWTGKKLPGIGESWKKVVAKVSLGKQKMIDLQTSKKTFIANGFVSHNSTAITGYLYHKTITSSGVTTALVGYNNDLTAELLDKIKTFYRTTPNALKPTIHYNTKYEISFPKVDSKILVLPSTENVGRGYTINNCLSGDTDIIMKDFSNKKIKDIAPGDIIINGKGGFSNVTKLIKTKNTKKLVNISSYGSDNLIVTEDHKVLTRQFLTGIPLWKEAKELKRGDYLAYPYFQSRNRIKTIDLPYLKSKSNNRINPVSRKINVTPEFGLFVGWFLAEGSFDGMRLTLSIDKVEIDNVIHIVDEIRPYVGKISINKSNSSNTAAIRIYGKEFGTLISNMFGNGALNKTINKSVWNWGWDVGYAILKGIIDGDGYIKEKNKVQITTISPQLANSIKRLMVSLRLGLPSIYKTEDLYRYKVKNQTRYDILLSGKGNYKLRRKLNYELPVFNNKRALWRTENLPFANQGGGYWRRGKKYYWAKISFVEEAEHEEYVYDLSLGEDPHSFLTHAGVVHNCLLTEVPFWEKAEEKLVTLEASVPVNGKIIIESSPGAVGDYFHRMWVSENDYVKKEYGWWWNYSNEEIEIIKRRMNNPRKFNNNYSLEFLISGRSVFTQETINLQRKSVLKVGDSVKLSDGAEHIVREEEGFRIYKPPEPGHFYSVGADCSEGVTGGDYSVAVILDRTNGEEVGMWRGLVAPDRFAKILDKWGRKYNNALMVVEMEAHGNVVLNILKQMLYPSLYFRPSRFDTLGNPFSEKLGWKTTKLTRPILLDEFEMMAREGNIIIRSKEIVDEMNVFVFDESNSMRAMESYHDDAIFAIAISIQGFKMLSRETPTQLSYQHYLPAQGY